MMFRILVGLYCKGLQLGPRPVNPARIQIQLTIQERDIEGDKLTVSNYRTDS